MATTPGGKKGKFIHLTNTIMSFSAGGVVAIAVSEHLQIYLHNHVYLMRYLPVGALGFTQQILSNFMVEFIFITVYLLASAMGLVAYIVNSYQLKKNRPVFLSEDWKPVPGTVFNGRDIAN